jgi:NAD(P)-dependent dehydrogenase (short-subunit alcohol dehydrogenase family)
VSGPDLFSLQGRVAVVTGAAGLLGPHHCRALLDAGAVVVVADLDEARCQGLAAELGPRAVPFALDVTRKESVARLSEAMIARYGGVDVLVNNAAINDMVEKATDGERSRFEGYPLEAWQRSLDVNVTGTFLCCQVLGARMAERGRGSIVNIASTYGMVAPDQAIYRRPDGTQSFFKSAAYPATKGAVLALTRFVATYWAARGVRCNAISPGGVENGQEEHFVRSYAARTPLGRLSRPTELAGALLFLAGDASSYVTGSNVVVDGGWTAW